MKAWMPLILVACSGPDQARPSQAGSDTDPSTTGSMQTVDRLEPVRGGGLTTLDDGRMAAIDVDTDRVVVFDPVQLRVDLTIQLERGSVPFRLEAAAGRVVATLRGTHAVAAFDVATGEQAWSAEACIEPRGLSYDGTGSVYVACHAGTLVELDAADGAVLRRQNLGLYEHDLRDVVFDGTDLYVTRFRNARVLRIDPADLSVLATFDTPELNSARAPFNLRNGHLLPTRLAWKAIARPEGGVIVLHQRAEREAITLTPPEPGASDPTDFSYGRPTGEPGPNETHCIGILHTSWTEFDPFGVLDQGPVVAPPAMATDIALSDDDTVLLSAIPAGGQGASRSFPRKPVSDFDCLQGARHETGTDGVVVAVAWSGSRRVVQTRMPFGLFVEDESIPVPDADQPASYDPAHLPGWKLFHETSPSGVSCGSCHPEGLDDGFVWHFWRDGFLLERRTMPFGGVLSTTAPYHWDGEMGTFDGLLVEVFQNRMGGAPADVAHADSMLAWLDTVQPPARDLSLVDAESAERGRQLFEDPDYACSTCHATAQLTNNQTVDVGTGPAVQVPTLRGVAGRGPWMRVGCTTTLEGRFDDPDCGGTDHGGGVLTDQTIADLVAYLRTL